MKGRISKLLIGGLVLLMVRNSFSMAGEVYTVKNKDVFKVPVVLGARHPEQQILHYLTKFNLLNFCWSKGEKFKRIMFINFLLN